MKKILTVTLLILSSCVSTTQTVYDEEVAYDYEIVEKNGKYIFVDEQGNYVKKLGTWDKIEHFSDDHGGFAKVWKENKEYYLDTLGNTYRVAYELLDTPNPAIEALALSPKHFDAFPMEVLQYPNLQVLIIDGSYANEDNFTALPAEIVKLKRLRFLSLQYCALSTLPDNLGALKHLQVLCLKFNQLKSLPESIGKLKKLKKLDLGDNQLTDLPESISKLQKLNTLN
ncbi:MAG: leucine-rich repeat domain-containing protein [Thermonemataceae bacterium]